MSLRADISELQHDVMASSLWIVKLYARCIACAFRLEIAVEQHRAEAGPVLRCTRAGTQDTVEWIGIDGPALRHERSIEKRRRKIRAAAKRRLGSELFEHQLLHRVVEHAPTGANAGLARRTVPEAPRRFRREARKPCNRSGSARSARPGHRARPGRWARRLRRRTCLHQSWLAHRGSDKDNGGVLTRTEGLYVMQNVGERSIEFPAEAVVQGKVTA